jgi:hypothetical protein
MHWTAFLAYRRFPENARVADDLPCIGCGDNLRSLPARANCAECGRPVGDSLFVLAQPQVVGNCLKSIGATFFGVLILFLPCLSINALWPPIVAMGVLTACAATRTVSVFELRSKGAIQSLPIIGSRLRMLQIVSIAETALSVAAFVLMWLSAQTVGPGGIIEKAALISIILWFVLYLATAIVAGLLGSSIATMLAYFLSRWEFILHRVGAAICALLVASAIALNAGRASTTALVITTVLAAMILAGSMILLALGLIHLGGGAEHEYDTWDDVLETDEP